MSDESKLAKERMTLKLPEDLLDELEKESNEKGVSRTALIEESLRNRKKASEAAGLTTEQAIVKALRLCPECAQRYYAYARMNPPNFVTKALREYWWRIIEVWPHGKFETGCPGWEKEAAPEDLKRVWDEMAKEVLDRPAGWA